MSSDTINTMHNDPTSATPSKVVRAEDSSAETFAGIVRRRRSIRKFAPNVEIPEAVMNECLDLALLAANSSNLQPWEFYWVRTPELKAQFGPACLDQNAAKTAAELVVLVARRDTWKRNRDELMQLLQQEGDVPEIVHKYYTKLVPFMYNQGPLGLFGFLKRLMFFFAGLGRPVPRGPVSQADMRTWAVKSTALAAENLMLALSAHGFDSCPMEGFDGRRVARLLHLPRGAEVVMVLAAGKGVPEGVYGPRVRLPRERVIFEV